MALTDASDTAQASPAAPSLVARALLVVLCLAAGLAYRVIVGVVPASGWQAGFLSSLAALFLVVAVVAKRAPRLRPLCEPHRTSAHRFR